MKKNLTINGKMFVTDLREFCIKHDYFTCGNNEQYETMFNVLRDYDERGINDEIINKIATMIFKYSDIENEYGIIENVSNIRFQLLNECVTYFYNDEYETETENEILNMFHSLPD